MVSSAHLRDSLKYVSAVCLFLDLSERRQTAVGRTLRRLVDTQLPLDVSNDPSVIRATKGEFI